MTLLDWIVLVGTMVGIAAYGTWRTRHTDHLDTYLKGNRNTGWVTIGISVAATQASAITFLSIPGQGYESGLGFVQNYFGLPLALIIVCAVFLPIYRKLGVYTAYEYLGNRFDKKTRLLGAIFFLMQRGVQAGITIYAPAIILSTVLGWPLKLLIVIIGVVVVVYTVTGGSAAVNLTQKWQMGVIFGGMVTAFAVLVAKLPDNSLHIAGALGKLEAVDFSFNPNARYTFWSGLLGGLFLSLSYFGTDQSQVQRYIGGAALREGRLGLMFNALLKIPMQLFILLLGALVFVFYQFQPNPPVFFNRVEWQQAVEGPHRATFVALEQRHTAAHVDRQQKLNAWLAVRENADPIVEPAARAAMVTAQANVDAIRAEAKKELIAAKPSINTKDSDYVFITFILTQLPSGVVGLLIAVMFAAALGSKAGELNALGTTTTIDLWRAWRPLAVHNEARNVRNAKIWTAAWGAFSVCFALFFSFQENLIEGTNIIASLFYGVVLGLFLVAFFFKHVRGHAVFWAALLAEVLIWGIFLLRHEIPKLNFSYLWYNVIGCFACVIFSLLLQAVLPKLKTTDGHK
ncbi:sodium:solute symporter [Oleiharenicola lentus]|uniref:sodium:solute symporter n=1 Tax=Oleiharenicola lentus TaxID=2508720 RepID=UPI003F679411